MTYEEILQDLKKRIFKPIYLLMGDEPYYIDKITNYLADHVLNESEKAFNQIVVYGNDTDAVTVDNTARRYPMMANHQLIIVKECQNLKGIDDLVHFAGNPLKSTILVLNYKYKAFDKRKKLYNEIKKNGVIFESKKLYENQVPAWVTEYLKNQGYSIEPVASNLLTEFLGTDLGKIANELDKLIISIPKGSKISTELIEKNIGISKEYNNYELQTGLGKKDILKVNRIVNYFSDNQKENPITVTITTLFFFFNKILIYHFLKDKSQKNVAATLQVNPYFVKEYELAAKKYDIKKTVNVISILREYDMKSKGVDNVSFTPGDLLKEMVFKIMH